MNKLLAVNIGEVSLGNNATLQNTYGNGGASILVSVILKNSLIIAGLIFLCLLVFGGIMFIASAGGDEKKASQSKAAITSAIIGFAVVFSAYFIIQIIQVITGVQILNPTL